MECIFCKIVEAELPALRVYEDKRIMAFLDINPINKGHLLVIPKEHYSSFLELPKDLLKEFISRVQDLAKAVLTGAGAKSFNLMVNNGEAAGQLVKHVHVHVIPRFDGDNLHPWPGKALNSEEMARIAENIKKSL